MQKKIPKGGSVYVYMCEHFIFYREIEDLTRSQTYLTDLVERVGIPVFTDLHSALDCAVKIALQVGSAIVLFSIEIIT